MTRTLLVTASAASAMFALAGPVAAQTIGPPLVGQATFHGTAQGACITGAPSSPSAENAVVSGLAPGTADIAIDQLVDDDGALRAATVVLLLPAICNQAHTLGVSSLNGGLANESVEEVPAPFRATAPYEVTVSWNNQQQVFATENDSLSVSVDEASSGMISLIIQIPAGGAPLAAGAYSDQLVVNLGVAG